MPEASFALGMSQVEKVQAVFDEWAQNGRAEGMERGHGPTARQAFDRLALRDQQRYLDIGCGNGYTLRWALEGVPTAEAWGLDVSARMIELATRMSLEHKGDKHFIAGRYPNSELPKEYFDAIFSMEVFYYLPSVDEGLAAIREALRPGGLFACVVDFYRENEASHGWPADLGVAMTLWSAQEWRSGFERAGLEVVEQTRLYPTQEHDAEGWKQSEGSLMTLGRKL